MREEEGCSLGPEEPALVSSAKGSKRNRSWSTRRDQ